MIRLEPRFAELAAMTNFSFLRGASHPEEMVARAAELGSRESGSPTATRWRASCARMCSRARTGRRWGHAGRPRRAARLRRRNAGPPRLSEGPRRLRPPLPHPHRRQPARAEGRVSSADRGCCSSMAKACRSWRCPSLLGRSRGGRRRRSARRDAAPHPSRGRGVGGEGRRSPASATPSASACGSARA